MPELYDMLEDLQELLVLYKTNELRQIDIEAKVHRWQKEVDRFDAEMDAQYEIFREKLENFG
jgi:hypothetical protein